MLKEAKGLEYTLEILRAFRDNPGQHDSREIHGLVQAGGFVQSASLSYVQKILPRMVKAGLLLSSEAGYSLSRPFAEITTDMVLDICEMPEQGNTLFNLCSQIKRSVALVSINDFYNVSPPVVNSTTTTELPMDLSVIGDQPAAE